MRSTQGGIVHRLGRALAELQTDRLYVNLGDSSFDKLLARRRRPFAGLEVDEDRSGTVGGRSRLTRHRKGVRKSDGEEEANSLRSAQKKKPS